MMQQLLRVISTITIMTSLLLAGDLRVNIINGTSNTPGQADRVVLMDISTGMTEIDAITNANGSVTFRNLKAERDNRFLIQGYVGGVTYSSVFAPTAGVTAWETSITVYDHQDEVTDLTVTVPYFVIYAFEDRLYIQKRLIFENKSNPPVTFSKTPGLIKVHIPEDVLQLDYLTFKSETMPLRTQAIKTDNGQVLPNALKPGISEVDIAYYLPYESGSAVVTEKIRYDIDHFHVYTMPLSLNISSPGLSREGTDNENGLAIYAINQVSAGTNMQIQVSGQGMAENQEHEHEQQQNDGRIVVEHRLPTSTKLVLSGVLIMLIFLALFISITQQTSDLKQESVDMLKRQKQALLFEYSKATNSKVDQVVQDKILHQLVSVYKTLDRIK